MAEQLYPFTKNRYFKRKRMRTVDFQREQAYVEHKLSFMNHCNLGSGIAVGLGVQRLDAQSLLVEPGVAVDNQGRFLIVDEPAICRLRTLSGFSEMKGETALLLLSYAEEKFDSMFLADETGELQDYAAVRERYSLSLSNPETLPQSGAHKILFSDTVLFEDSELRVRQVIPRVLTATGITQIRLILENTAADTLEVGLHYAPNLPGFTLADTGGTVKLTQRVHLRVGINILCLSIATTAKAQAISASLAEENFTLEKRGITCHAKNAYREEFSIVSGNPLYELERRLTALSPQELWCNVEDGIPLATIRFVHYENECLLHSIIPNDEDRHVALPYLTELLRQCSTYFGQRTAQEPPPKTPETPAQEPASKRSRMTTGTVTLTTGLHMGAGKILYSEEIAHNLGPGTVFVEFGVENLYPAVNLQQNRTDLLLGDVSLFEQASGNYGHPMACGVRIHPEKGTFELAVRHSGDLQQASLRLRWFAWRPDETVTQKPEVGTLLRLEPDVIRVPPGAVVNFIPVFSTKTGAPCDFFMANQQSGVVTRDGVYTAPDKEGLYQIYAQTRDHPEEKVNAFIIVRQSEAKNGSGAV